jgi:hypothetical protein
MDYLPQEIAFFGQMNNKFVNSLMQQMFRNLILDKIQEYVSLTDLLY